LADALVVGPKELQPSIHLEVPNENLFTELWILSAMQYA
jgi:hypothetical protein